MLRWIALLCAATPLIAQDSEVPQDLEEDVLEGHSEHGEVFNEGPRQAAVLMEGTGEVELKVGTENAVAQKFFNQGVGQLHGFWFLEAERSFRQVAMIDPGCAMAYWGMAMANGNNKKRGRETIESAIESKAAHGSHCGK